MRPFSIALVISVITLFAAPASAFNAKGHELVGAIADDLLTKSPVRAQLQKLIGVPLAEAAKWADCARSVSPHDGVFKFEHNDRYDAPCIPLEMAVDAEGKHYAIERMEDFVSRNWSNCENNGKRQNCHATYHYTDVSVTHDAYKRGLVGTRDTDIIAAINAAIARIQGKPVPAPFSIKDEAEAVFMLAHYIGDLSQPLHVGAVYLDDRGNIVDPDAPNAPSYEETAGGNQIHVGSRSLHQMWDDVPSNARWAVERFAWEHQGTASQRLSKIMLPYVSMPPFPGEKEVTPAPPVLSELTVAWATESLGEAKRAFSSMSFEPGPVKEDGRIPDHSWIVTSNDGQAFYFKSVPRGKDLSALGYHRLSTPAYIAASQEELVVEAGARLAYLLNELFLFQR